MQTWPQNLIYFQTVSKFAFFQYSANSFFWQKYKDSSNVFAVLMVTQQQHQIIFRNSLPNNTLTTVNIGIDIKDLPNVNDHDFRSANGKTSLQKLPKVFILLEAGGNFHFVGHFKNSLIHNMIILMSMKAIIFCFKNKKKNLCFFSVTLNGFFLVRWRDPRLHITNVKVEYVFNVC